MNFDGKFVMKKMFLEGDTEASVLIPLPSAWLVLGCHPCHKQSLALFLCRKWS